MVQDNNIKEVKALMPEPKRIECLQNLIKLIMNVPCSTTTNEPMPS